jgi:hypothetical protein
VSLILSLFSFFYLLHKLFDLYLQAVQVLLTKVREEDVPAGEKNKISQEKLVMPSTGFTLTLKLALDCCGIILNSIKQTDYEIFEENLKKKYCPSNYNDDLDDDVNITKVEVDADELLFIIIEEWDAELKRRELYVKTLFNSADLDGNGTFTSLELASAIHLLHPQVSNDIVMEMHQDALKSSNSEKLNADAFLSVCKDHGLLDVWWMSGGNVFTVINDFKSLEQTWKTIAPFFYGTIKNVEQAMPLSHPLRKCEMSGDACLHCIKNRAELFTHLLLNEEGHDHEQKTKESWQTYWMLLKELAIITARVYKDQKEVESFIPGVTKRSALQNYRKKGRRNALPMILCPINNALRAETVDTMKGESGAIHAADAVPNPISPSHRMLDVATSSLGFLSRVKKKSSFRRTSVFVLSADGTAKEEEHMEEVSEGGKKNIMRQRGFSANKFITPSLTEDDLTQR